MPVTGTTELPNVTDLAVDTSTLRELAASWTDVLNNGEYVVEFQKDGTNEWRPALGNRTVIDSADNLDRWAATSDGVEISTEKTYTQDDTAVRGDIIDGAIDDWRKEIEWSPDYNYSFTAGDYLQFFVYCEGNIDNFKVVAHNADTGDWTGEPIDDQISSHERAIVQVPVSKLNLSSGDVVDGLQFTMRNANSGDWFAIDTIITGDAAHGYNTSSLTIPYLADGHTYTARIRTNTDYKTGAWDTATGVTQLPAPQITNTERLKSVDIQLDHPKQDNSLTGDLNVYRSTEEGVKGDLLETLSQDTVSYTDTNAQPNTTYYYTLERDGADRTVDGNTVSVMVTTTWEVDGALLGDEISETVEWDALSLTTRLEIEEARQVLQNVKENAGSVDTLVDSEGHLLTFDTAPEGESNTVTLTPPDSKKDFFEERQYHIEEYDQKILENYGDVIEASIETVPSDPTSHGTAVRTLNPIDETTHLADLAYTSRELVQEQTMDGRAVRTTHTDSNYADLNAVIAEDGTEIPVRDKMAVTFTPEFEPTEIAIEGQPVGGSTWTTQTVPSDEWAVGESTTYTFDSTAIKGTTDEALGMVRIRFAGASVDDSAIVDRLITYDSGLMAPPEDPDPAQPVPFYFAFPGGVVQTMNVEQEISSATQDQVGDTSVTLFLSPDEARVVHDSLSQLGAVNVREVPDGENVPEDNTENKANTISVGSPDDDLIDSGTYVVSGYEIEYMNDDSYEVTLDMLSAPNDFYTP